VGRGTHGAPIVSPCEELVPVLQSPESALRRGGNGEAYFEKLWYTAVGPLEEVQGKRGGACK
jgi:hypothetical protein